MDQRKGVGSLRQKLSRASRSLCQDRFPKWVFRGSRKGPKKGIKKGFQNGPPTDPKWEPKWFKVDSKRGSENDRKLGPPFGRQKVRFCGYLLYFRGVGPLRKGSLLGPLFGTILGTKVAQKES